MPFLSGESSPAPSVSRLHYSVALAGALLAARWTGGGWPNLPPNMRTAGLVTLSILLVTVIARLVWIWRSPGALVLPSSPALRRISVWAFRLSLFGTLVLFLAVGAPLFFLALPSDTRGAVSLVMGLLALPFVALAPIGLFAFEVARGWGRRSTVPAESQTFLGAASVLVTLVTVMPSLVTGLPRHLGIDSIPRLLSLTSPAILAVGVGWMILRARQSVFPVMAVFGTAAAIALATGVGVTTLGTVLEEGALSTMTSGPGGVYFMFSLLASAAVTAVLTAVPLSIVPAIARRWASAGHDQSDRSGQARYWIAAAASVALVLSLGLAKQPTRLAESKPRPETTSLSEGELRNQARLLQQRCELAGTQVSSPQADVSAIEVVFPGQYPPDYARFPALPVEPTPTSPGDWFPREAAVPGYESVVLTFNGERRGYSRDPTQVGGYRQVNAEAISPRFALTWQRLDSAEDVSAGIAGIEFRAFDRQKNIDVATHRMFFKRETASFGFGEACAASSDPTLSSDYAFGWLAAILVPAPRTEATEPDPGKIIVEPDQQSYVDIYGNPI